MTILIDVPYIREFHRLPDETKFRFVLEGVQLVEAFQFVPWPGAFTIPEGLSWEESQRLRDDNYKKGRLESIDWQTLALKLVQTEQYEISNATLFESADDANILKLQLTDYSGEEFPEIRIAAEMLHIFESDRELPLEEFLSLGGAYWKAFAERANKHRVAHS